MPRTDNDYIYFRDYNTGATSDRDPGNWYHSWINTWFATNNYGQAEEIFYDHKYVITAQFTKADGSGYKEFNLWERFVDWNGSYNTVIWKIQPPDGYKYVRFCLCENVGNNVRYYLRTTALIEYQLGDVYQKTGCGTYDYQNDRHCHWNAPVSGTHWSTYWGTSVRDPQTNSNISISAPDGQDHRKYTSNTNTVTTGLKQAEKYEPTAQKIIFHCNSKKVWHNIHIEFFDSNRNPIHQKFPGYLMEPYAYANNEYRINGYLTYELTIPKDAVYFRVNNGVTGSQGFKYYTQITELHHEGCANWDTWKKMRNYGNYFMLSDSNNIQNGAVTYWGDNFIKAYNGNRSLYLNYDPDFELTSDYDYIYFEKPDYWKSNVYAYFYSGGDLRTDNWMRAIYSVYPGVTAAGMAENNAGTVYGYTVQPDSTFVRNGKTVYRFRCPLGDREILYDKVLFSDGYYYLGGNQTKVISYHEGELYNASGSFQVKMHSQNSTASFTKRGDYLYVRVNPNSTWDDIHVLFYDAGGALIGQKSGSGYLMNYSGTQGGYWYYNAPIPSNAASFSLNNGSNKSGSYNHSTSKKPILRLSTTTEPDDKSDYTKGGMVYTLTDANVLTQTEPHFTTSQQVISLGGTPTENLDYAARGDYIYLRSSIADAATLYAVQFRFYDSDGQAIGTPAVGLKLENQDGLAWVRKSIPVGAAQFSIDGGTTKHDIFRLTTETTGTAEDFTTGSMYFTLSNSTLTLDWPTYTVQSTGITYPNDETYDKRGDSLDLVYSNNTDWANMHVTFYDADNQVLTQGVTVKYVGELSLVTETDLANGVLPVDGKSTTEPLAAGHWYTVTIPYGAASFKIYDAATEATSTKHISGDIFTLRRKMAWARQDYTLGGMQYRITDSNSLERFYPLFTERPVYTMPDNEEVTSNVPDDQVFSSDAAEFKAASVTAVSENIANVPSPLPVLYATNSNNVTYSWTEGENTYGPANNRIWFDNSHTNWSTPIKAYFYGGSGGNPAWNNGGYTMAYDSTTNLYWCDVPGDYSNVIFSENESETNRSEYTGLNASNYYGRSCVYHPEYGITTTATVTGDWIYFENPGNGWNNCYVHLWGGTNSANTGWPGLSPSYSGSVIKAVKRCMSSSRRPVRTASIGMLSLMMVHRIPTAPLHRQSLIRAVITTAPLTHRPPMVSRQQRLSA